MCHNSQIGQDSHNFVVKQEKQGQCMPLLNYPR
jgi:hypothetical protein